MESLCDEDKFVFSGILFKTKTWSDCDILSTYSQNFTYTIELFYNPSECTCNCEESVTYLSAHVTVRKVLFRIFGDSFNFVIEFRIC